jgi:serine/threonine-protein kinase
MVPERIGHYRIVRLVAEDSRGAVYQALDEQLHREVSIRILSKGALPSENALARFRSLVSHPNIQAVYDLHMEDGVTYMVADYVPGSRLEERMSRGRLQEKEVVRLGAQLAEGLAAAHQHGVLHGELNPNNLWLIPDGELKILDFGLGRQIWPTSEVPAQEVHGYLAPEQLRGEPAVAGSDIYAMGAVLYQMATGRRLFGKSFGSRLTQSILKRAPLPPRSFNPRISLDLERIILKCLEKRVADRYPSAREVALALGQLARARGGVRVEDLAALKEFASTEELERRVREIEGEIRRLLAPLKEGLTRLLVRRNQLHEEAGAARRRFFQVAKQANRRLEEHRSLRSQRRGQHVYVVWDDNGPQYSTQEGAEPPPLSPLRSGRRGVRVGDLVSWFKGSSGSG